MSVARSSGRGRRAPARRGRPGPARAGRRPGARPSGRRRPAGRGRRSARAAGSSSRTFRNRSRKPASSTTASSASAWLARYCDLLGRRRVVDADTAWPAGTARAASSQWNSGRLRIISRTRSPGCDAHGAGRPAAARATRSAYSRSVHSSHAPVVARAWPAAPRGRGGPRRSPGSACARSGRPPTAWISSPDPTGGRRHRRSPACARSHHSGPLGEVGARVPAARLDPSVKSPDTSRTAHRGSGAAMPTAVIVDAIRTAARASATAG